MASVYRRTPFAALVPGDFDAMIAANLAAPYHTALAAARRMLDQPARRDGLKGKIVNVGDWATERPYKDYLPYLVAKGGLTTMTLALADELAPHVTVNMVQPAMIDPPPDLTRRGSRGRRRRHPAAASRARPSDAQPPDPLPARRDRLRHGRPATGSTAAGSWASTIESPSSAVGTTSKNRRAPPTIITVQVIARFSGRGRPIPGHQGEGRNREGSSALRSGSCGTGLSGPRPRADGGETGCERRQSTAGLNRVRYFRHRGGKRRWWAGSSPGQIARRRRDMWSSA